MVYVVAALAPLIVATVADAGSGSGFWIDFSVALALSGLAILCMQFALVARLQRVAAPFGMDALHQFHRQIAVVALVLLLAHPTLIFVSDPGWLALLNPRNAPRQVWFGVVALIGLLLIAASSFGRKRLGISYEVWQVLHGVLATTVVVVALAHADSWNRYLANPWQKGLWAVMALVVLGIAAWMRVIKPLRVRSRPWRVVSVKEERGNAWTLEIEPQSHTGIEFLPGQFAWILIEQSPFRITQHPFSIASSAEDPGHRLRMTIKARGDFTRSIREVSVGARAYVDGPYGLFSPDRYEGPGFVLIAGGVGITPLISMIRTWNDRDDARPVWLFYGNKDWGSITFREELAELSQQMNLHVVHALEEAPDELDVEHGFIDAAMLQRHLDRHFKRMRYFICGPTPMMDAIERVLAELGVPPEHVFTERFDVV